MPKISQVRWPNSHRVADFVVECIVVECIVVASTVVACVVPAGVVVAGYPRLPERRSRGATRGHEPAFRRFAGEMRQGFGTNFELGRLERLDFPSVGKGLLQLLFRYA